MNVAAPSPSLTTTSSMVNTAVSLSVMSTVTSDIVKPLAAESNVASLLVDV